MCDNTLVFLFLDVTRLASIIVLICEKSTQLAINKLELGWEWLNQWLWGLIWESSGSILLWGTWLGGVKISASIYEFDLEESIDLDMKELNFCIFLISQGWVTPNSLPISVIDGARIKVRSKH
jgi:hypothetical protein